MRLLGRQAECHALDRLLTDAIAGHSGVMVLRGEAGIGKSALLAYISIARGMYVAKAVGVESEMGLAVCIVEDAQWLDQASEQTAFVSRRLLAERVAVVCAARTGIGDGVLAGLPELVVGRLGESDSLSRCCSRT
jgi:AAA ATPase domain